MWNKKTEAVASGQVSSKPATGYDRTSGAIEAMTTGDGHFFGRLTTPTYFWASRMALTPSIIA